MTAQLQSGLLTLPLEIRKLVFDYLIGGPGICISENGTRATGVEVPTQYRTVNGRRLITCHHQHESDGQADKRFILDAHVQTTVSECHFSP